MLLQILREYQLFSFVSFMIGISCLKTDVYALELQAIDSSYEEQDLRPRSDALHGSKEKFKCPSMFGIFSDIEDCSAYYVCFAGISTRKECPRTTRYDMYRKVCLSFLIAVCDKGGKITTNPGKSTTVKESKFSCPGLVGNFAHPEDCSKYYTCTFYYPTLKSCTGNNLFDEAKKECKPEKEVDCGTRKIPTKKFTCPSIVGNFIYPEDCSKYYSCTFYISSLKSCPGNSLFDGVKKECMPEEEVHCGTRKRPTRETTTVTTPMPPTVTEQPTTSEQPRITILTTTTKEPTTTEVPTSKEDSTTISTSLPKPTGPPDTDCDENDLDCIITETGEIPEWFECPKALGLYPHPSSNRLFIYCQNWKPFAKKCGQDLIFSDELRSCISPSRGKQKLETFIKLLLSVF